MLRRATVEDIPALLAIEQRCFSSDRVSRRSFRHLLTHGNAILLLEEQNQQIRAYVLLLFSRGTSVARLYSIAIDPAHQRHGLGSQLLVAAEKAALEHECVSVRLEVRRDNPASLALFRQHGYRPFEEVLDYYEDHMDALRFEKCLVPQLQTDLLKVPYYQANPGFYLWPRCTDDGHEGV